MTTPTPQVRFVNPPELMPPFGFSHVVDVTGGRFVYIAGQIALDRERQLIAPGDFQRQAEIIFENIRVALSAVGADFSHVVKLNYYLINIADLPRLRDIRDRYINTQYPPASTAVQVGALAFEGVLLEIEAIANIAM